MEKNNNHHSRSEVLILAVITFPVVFKAFIIRPAGSERLRRAARKAYRRLFFGPWMVATMVWAFIVTLPDIERAVRIWKYEGHEPEFRKRMDRELRYQARKRKSVALRYFAKEVTHKERERP